MNKGPGKYLRYVFYKQLEIWTKAVTSSPRFFSSIEWAFISFICDFFLTPDWSQLNQNQ